jgi:hypothetical protein
VVFEVLELDGRRLTARPYEERRAELERLQLADRHWLDEAGFAIEDEDSRNRTYVDGRPLGRGERAAIRTGTFLRIGKEWLGVSIELVSSG